MKYPRTSRRSWLATAAGAAAASAVPPTRAQSSSNGWRRTIADVHTYRLADALFVKVVADDGSTGWGETAADDERLMETFVRYGLRENVVGENVFDAERLWDRMFYDHHDLGPGGALTNAIAGVDIALWDLRARLLGMPVYALIGGSYRERVKAYASFGVGFGRRLSVDEAAEKARKFVGKGFRAVKVRIQIREPRQNPDPDPTLEYARAVREAIGPDTELIVDINNGYTAQRAIEVGRRLNRELGVRYYEEPVSDQLHEDSATVAAALDELSIIAGEKEYTRWQIRDLIVHGNVDYLNPDVVKAGGLTEMKKIAALAQAFEKPIIAHNTRPTFSTAATLHFLASISNCGPFVEFPDVDEFEELLSLVEVDYRFEDGFLYVPQTAGIGVTVDEAAVEAAALG